MAAEAVKVICRCRPSNERERLLNCKVSVHMDSARGQCSLLNPNDEKAPPKMFTFDGSYYLNSTTEAIYADIAYPLVEVTNYCFFIQGIVPINCIIVDEFMHRVGLQHGYVAKNLMPFLMHSP